ncbi:MAG TPA: sigma 54-interacting transcriptional regulator [Terriglobales bacterium]|jgi:two-component system, NtrC family, response regulator AtoC|nr:sigma 54-interacting transcriptional regulator [Terriglobales bacterium]
MSVEETKAEIGNMPAVPVEPATKLFVEACSPSMRSVEAVLGELAGRDLPVLLMAEPGAGKHAAARFLHEMSQRKEESFQAVCCADLTPDLLVAGAASIWGAGTVYLDEFADLPKESQLELFRLLTAIPGNGHPILQARLICGTSRDLEMEVKSGRLREDLYYRLSGVSLRLPPLRQRKEDVPQLVAFFLEKYSREFRCALPRLSDSTLQLFQEYAWPGNIRELEDAAKAIVVLGDEALAMRGLRSMLQKTDRAGERVSLKQAARAASREAERELILKALTRTRWNRRRAAQELQISYKALLYKLKQIGFEEYGTS